MEPVRVGIREFRENLATYLLESSSPVAITRHGDTIGYYIPARRTRSEGDRLALKDAAGRLAAMLADRGVSEDELLQDFKRLRAAKRKYPSPSKGLPKQKPITNSN
jgi:PHD/YefM family antitoxin component YafN of YafNO toxin-antitoxin module